MLIMVKDLLNLWLVGLICTMVSKQSHQRQSSFGHRMNRKGEFEFDRAIEISEIDFRFIRYPYGQSFAANAATGYPGANLADQAALDTNKDGVFNAADDAFSPYYPGDPYVDWIGLSLC